MAYHTGVRRHTGWILGFECLDDISNGDAGAEGDPICQTIHELHLLHPRQVDRRHVAFGRLAQEAWDVVLGDPHTRVACHEAGGLKRLPADCQASQCKLVQARRSPELVVCLGTDVPRTPRIPRIVGMGMGTLSATLALEELGSRPGPRPGPGAGWLGLTLCFASVRVGV